MAFSEFRLTALEQSQLEAANDSAFNIYATNFSVVGSKNRRTIDDLWGPAYGALCVKSEQSAQTTIGSGARTERQECAIGVISETRKQRECFKVGLLLLAIRIASRQFTFEKPNQVTRFTRIRAKHSEVKFVIGDDVV